MLQWFQDLIQLQPIHFWCGLIAALDMFQIDTPPAEGHVMRFRVGSHDPPASAASQRLRH
jgi:hypothetical protein